MDTPEEKSGLIIIPDAHRKTTLFATVIEVGPGKVDSDGKRTEIEVKPGDRVAVAQWGGTELKVSGQTFKTYDTSEILAVLE